MPSNAHVRSKRDAPPGDANRVLIFATDEMVIAWVEKELDGLGCAIQLARSVREAVAALVEDPPPRPQIMIADFDAMGPADAFELHAIRNGGWFGSLIALGKVPSELHASLNVGRSIDRPLVDGVLRKAVAQVGLDRPTMKIRTLR